MKKWRVWFRQIDQMFIDVQARTEKSAILKAKREWEDTHEPYVIVVEERSKK